MKKILFFLLLFISSVVFVGCDAAVDKEIELLKKENDGLKLKK
jgi:hypothetical protein